MSQAVEIQQRQTTDDAELREALEDALNRHFAVSRRVVSLSRRPSPYSSSYALEELEARFDDGRGVEVMFKNLSWQAMLADAQRAKPKFLYNPLREIETYRTVLASEWTGAPACYGAVVDERRGRYWLFLEKVDGYKMRHVGEFETWQRVARWLARMHARFQNVEALTEEQTRHLLRYDADFFRLWMRRAYAFLHTRASSLPPAALRDLDYLSSCYDGLIKRLARLPLTLIHGDFFASNVIAQEEAGALRVCPVDWEMAGLGCGLIDLAALTSGTWTERQRVELALAYYEALAPEGARRTSAEEFLADLDCCQLYLAIQWLGWATHWSPPSDEAQDWLSVALRLARKLSL